MLRVYILEMTSSRCRRSITSKWVLVEKGDRKS